MRIEFGFFFYVQRKCSSKILGQGEDRIWIDDVTCQGTEKDFFDCYKTMEYHNCYHFEDAGVICSQGTCTTYNHLCLIYLYFLNLF